MASEDAQTPPDVPQSPEKGLALVQGIHGQKHRLYVPGCLLCKMSTVSVAPSATPSRQSAHAKWAKRKDKEWATDMAAYKRLRNDGLQPRQIDGSADLEAKSTEPEHVATGHSEWPIEKIREAEDLMGHKLNDGGARPWRS